MPRHKGTLVDWNDDRGFGFIQPATGGERVFCHIKAFRNLTQRPVRGQVFTYELAMDKSGRARALDVHHSDATRANVSARKPSRVPARSRMTTALVTGCVFFVLLVALVLLERLPWLVFPWYLLLSFVTFVLYGWDKASATGGYRRTPEKASFQNAFWSAVVLNVLVLGAMAYGGPDVWGNHVPGAHEKSYKEP
jgi:cold shock CspA family protein